MKENLAIFDLDGTLFDTTEVNYLAYKESLINYGIEIDKEYFYKFNGRHYTEFLPQIMGNSEYIDEIHEMKKQKYVENLGKAKANVHLFEYIKAIQEKYYIAIVTTASRKNTLDILSFFDVDKLFEHLVTQENIQNRKPNPEGFLSAMNYFEIDREHTVIFEDSQVGIEAARATGATVMVVDQF